MVFGHFHFFMSLNERNHCYRHLWSDHSNTEPVNYGLQRFNFEWHFEPRMYLTCAFHCRFLMRKIQEFIDQAGAENFKSFYIDITYLFT